MRDLTVTGVQSCALPIYWHTRSEVGSRAPSPISIRPGGCGATAPGRMEMGEGAREPSSERVCQSPRDARRERAEPFERTDRKSVGQGKSAAFGGARCAIK